MGVLETDGLDYVISTKTIKELIGKKVIIWVGAEARNNFDTSASICGRLESHPQLVNNYRVVVNEDTYTYFTEKELVDIFVPSKPSENKAEALIKINIKC